MSECCGRFRLHIFELQDNAGLELQSWTFSFMMSFSFALRRFAESAAGLHHSRFGYI